MAVKSDRQEIRVSHEERTKIERAANMAQISVSAFCRESAVEKAEKLIAEQTTTVVPADFFDSLLSAIDKPDKAQNLAKAARKTHLQNT